jgi:hypothetical protein
MTKLLTLLLSLTVLTGAESFKVGDAVESEYAASWYAGKVVEVMTGKYAGWYKIKYDKDGSISAASGARMRRAGQELSTPPTLKPEDTFGSWTLSTVTQTTSTDSTHRYTTTSLYAQGDLLTIRADGTYQWKMGGKPISGRWSREPNPREYWGPIILENGWQNQRWWVGFNGRSANGVPNVYIRSEYGSRYWGSKVN